MQIKLREYQKQGIDLIKQKKNFGIFWQQRLGKTIVAIKAIESYKKVIIAVPNNTILHWYTEIMNNIYVENINILPRQKTKRLALYNNFNKTDQMWIIASYDTISQDYLDDNTILKQFNYIVLDEAHFLRNSKSRRAKGINKLRIKADYALALSGTPAVNSAIDLLRIFKFLFPNSNYSYKYIYKKKYFHPVKVPGSKKINWELKPEMIKEWESFLCNMCDIKKVHDYLKWLPKNIEKTVMLEMEKDQRFHYDKMLFESKRIIASSKKGEKKRK